MEDLRRVVEVVEGHRVCMLAAMEMVLCMLEVMKDMQRAVEVAESLRHAIMAMVGMLSVKERVLVMPRIFDMEERV